MPHKHTRRGTDPTDYDLPPTQIARPLPVAPNRKAGKAGKPGESEAKPKGTKRKRGGAAKNDDTPRGFRRLMAFAQGKSRSGLDDGKPKSSKKGGTDKKEQEKEAPTIPEMRPGEHVSDYAARVDAALPLSGLMAKTGKRGKDPLGFKARQTRKEKSMHKLYDQWRAEEEKIKERKEEEAELEAEKALEDGTLMFSSGVQFDEDMNTGRGEGKKRKRRKARSDKEEDPWEELRRKRGERKPGLRNVASAPPSLGDLKAIAKLPTRT